MDKGRFLCLLLLCVLQPLHTILAQKIVCQVKVSLEKMPMENQDKLAYLQGELESYINSFEWSEDEFGYDVNCEMEIAFDEVKTVSYEDRYTATIIVSNGIDLQYADRRWIFALNEQERLVHSLSFHPFSSLIDFYLLLILGHEYDKLYDLGGQEYYDKARQISETAKFSTQYYRGWDRRQDLITQLTSQRMEPYRKLIFHYYTGYYFYESQEMDNARAHFNRAIVMLKQCPKEKLGRFYDLNYFYFSKALKDLKLSNELNTLDRMKPEK